MNFNTTMI